MPIGVAEETLATVERDPALLRFLLTTRKCSVGELVDLANGVPAEWVCDIAGQMADTITDHTDPARRRRQLVLLGALLNRIIFDLEAVPRSRDARI